jgi:Bax protein
MKPRKILKHCAVCLQGLQRSLLIGALLLIATPALASQPAKLPAKAHTLFNRLLPFIRQHNRGIAVQRKFLLKVQSRIYARQLLTHSQFHHFLVEAQLYDVTACSSQKSLHTPSCMQTLLHRVDQIPASLVLAQAAIESDWGTSRFAKEGHNYFGIWCYTNGCGMIPEARPKGATYAVRRFSSAAASVGAYFMIINTKPLYAQLRFIRARERLRHHAISGAALAEGLLHYSTRRQAYVDSVKQLIKDYHLSRYDA